MNKLYFLLHFLLLTTTYSILSIPSCYLSFNQQVSSTSCHAGIRTYHCTPSSSHTTQNNLFTYSSSQLKNYFDYHHYSDQEVLAQNSLYISDEFVQLAKTYPGYASHIRHLYKKLKHMSIVGTIVNTILGSYSKQLFKKIQTLHKEIEHNKQSIDTATAQCASFYAIDLEELCPYNSNLTTHNIYLNYLHILHEASLINKRNTIVRDCIGQASYIGLEANKNGYTQHALQLADFCWTLIDCAKAFGEGICLGTVRTIDTLTHPIETVKNGLIGIGIIACELGKLTKTTGDFALLYATNNDRYYIQKEAITKQLKMIIKDTTHYLHTTPTRKIVKQGTAFLTEGILLTKIGTFAHNIAQRLLPITKNYFEYVIKKEPTACLANGAITVEATERITSHCEEIANKYIQQATTLWVSKNGLIYGPDKKFGSRLNHILQHTRPNLSKLNHTIFTITGNALFDLIDFAWSKKGAPLANDAGTYIIDLGKKIGTLGETAIKIVTIPGTKEIITAYPIKV